MFPQFIDPRINTPSIFGTYQPSYHGGLHLPGMGNFGPALQMALSPYIHGFVGGQGMFPGQFSPVQNLFDQQLARSMMAQQQQAMAAVSGQDRAQLASQFRGMFSLFNPTNAVTPEQTQISNRLAGDISRVLPYLTPMAPQMVDSLFGARGSAMAMGMGFSQGGRFLADRFGTTGGLGGDQIGRLVKEIYSNFDPSQMRGLGGAQLGQLFAEASTRGFMGDMVGKDGKLDGKHVQNRLKELSGAVSAMKDIFGDLGRQDAPMSELFASLENLTQAGLSRLGAGRAERLAREVQQMAKLTGVGMDAILTMHAGAGQMAQSMGLDRSFAPQAVKGSLAFATAYGQTSAGFTAWGKMNKEEMMAYDQRLRMQAASSEIANQAGALLRLGEQGLLQGEAADLFKRIKAGDRSALNFQAPGEFIDMLSRSGVSRNAAAQAMQSRYANQELIQRYGLSDAVRERQRETDILPTMQAVLGQSVAATLSSRGVKRGQAVAMAGLTGDVLSKALFQMDRTLLGSDKTKERNAYLVEQLRGRLSPEQLASLGATAEEQNRALQEVVASGMGTLQEESRGIFGTDYVNVVTAHHQDTLDRARKVQAQARARAEVSQAMSKVPQLGALRGLMEELSQAGHDGKGIDLKSLAARFLGGVDKQDILKKAMPAFQDLHEKQKKVDAIQSEMENLDADTQLSAQEKQQRREALQKQLGTLAAEMKEKTDVISGFGLDVGMGQLAKMQRGEELLKLAGDRKTSTALLGKVGKAREELIKAARERGEFKGRDDADIRPEEMAQLLSRAADNKLGPAGKKAFDSLDKDITQKLRDGNISLDEFAKMLQEKIKKDEDAEKRKMTLEGTLKLLEDEVVIAAQGVPAPGGRP